jgi:hypothetical protein
LLFLNGRLSLLLLNGRLSLLLLQGSLSLLFLHRGMLTMLFLNCRLSLLFLHQQSLLMLMLMVLLTLQFQQAIIMSRLIRKVSEGRLSIRKYHSERIKLVPVSQFDRKFKLKVSSFIPSGHILRGERALDISLRIRIQPLIHNLNRWGPGSRYLLRWRWLQVPWVLHIRVHWLLMLGRLGWLRLQRLSQAQQTEELLLTELRRLTHETSTEECGRRILHHLSSGIIQR